MNEISEVMAKSEDIKKNQKSRSLLEHINDLLSMYNIILKESPLSEEVKKLIKIACITHDLGKINNKFQEKIKISNEIQKFIKLGEKENKKEIKKLELEKQDIQKEEIRHNLLSPAFMIKIVETLDLSRVNKNIVTKAVMLHHDNFEKYLNKNFSDIEKAIYEDIEKGIKFNNLNLNEIEKLIFEELSIKYNFSPENLYYDYFDLYNEKLLDTKNEDDTLISVNYILVKGFLNLIDHLASAQEGKKIKYYFDDKEIQNLDETLKRSIAGKNGINVGKIKFKTIQENILKFKDESIVLTEAFTGGGKTICDDRLTSKKKFYLAPNKISAMSFYIGASDKYNIENIGLLHGDISLYGSDATEINDGEITVARKDIDLARNFAKPYILATVDQVAMSMFKHTNYEKTLAAITGARICLDELHLLTPRMFLMFKYLMQFSSKYLNTKFHLMTATLPKKYKEELDFIKDINSSDEENSMDGEISLKVNISESKILEIVKRALKDKKQVLIIRNKVDDVISTYELLRKNLEENVEINCLHNRFKFLDKKNKYKEILNQTGDVWISTQSVEIALDLDFSVIISDLAPMESLIQRMGRCNRHNKVNIGEFYILDSKAKDVYEEVLKTESLALLKKVEKFPRINMDMRKDLLDKYYDTKAVEKYYEDEFKTAKRDIRKIFGISDNSDLSGEILMFEHEPYRNLADNKREAAKYFRDIELQIKVYLEEDMEKENLENYTLLISGRRYYSFLTRKLLIEKNGKFILINPVKKSVFEYTEEIGLKINLEEVKRIKIESEDNGGTFF